MDWENVVADVQKILSVHYTPGRNGNSINKIIIHHNGGNLSVDGCYNVWQNRAASAHYQVCTDGTIGQLVWDKDTAWHASNWAANLTSIGIEHADCQSDPWRISDKHICDQCGHGMRPEYQTLMINNKTVIMRWVCPNCLHSIVVKEDAQNGRPEGYSSR